MREIAVTVGAALIAGAILMTGHWQIVPGDSGVAATLRLNRWTGAVEVCMLDPKTGWPGKPETLAGAQLPCK